MSKIPLRLYQREIEELIDHGQQDAAIAHCRQILSVYPKHIDTYRLLGKAYLESQRYGDAADLFQRVISSVPDDFIAHLGLSIIREDEGHLDEAIWHMERAFEVQPANNAIQAELRRLYGRRDGYEPPKIRLTRGALARMYIKGNLYPQAIAELRSALAEEPERVDLLAMLARAYTAAGQRVEAADTCSTLLNKLPYSLDANRILSEILAGSERAAESASYRQRYFSLDPYAAQISAAAPTAERVPDAAVTVEKLDWRPGLASGPAASQPEWAASLGVKLDEPQASKEQLPSWLNGAAKEPATDAVEETPAPGPAAAAGFGEESILPAGEDDLIPDWMKDAGWTGGSGAAETPVDALSNASSDNIPENEAGALASADIPDWLQSLAPADVPEDLFDEESAPQAAAGIAAESPSWLQDIRDSPDEAASGGEEEAPAPEAPEPLPSPRDSAPAEPLPSWLASEPGSPVEEEIPDWLKEIAESEVPGGAETQPATIDFLASAESGPETPVELPPAELPAEPEPFEALKSETAEAGVPDWLAEFETMPEPEGAQELPTFSGPLGFETQAEADSGAGSELPDWLAGIPSESPAAGESLPGSAASFSEPEEPEAAEASAIPDWLAGLQAATPAELDEQTDLAPFEDTEETGAPAGLPDWLTNVELEPEEETAQSSFLLEEPFTAPQEPAASEADAGWLSDISAVVPAAGAAAFASTVWPEEPPIKEEDTKPSRPREETPLPEPSEPAASLEPESLSAWLQGLSEEAPAETAEPEPQAEAGSAGEEEAGPAPLPDWFAEVGEQIESGLEPEAELPSQPSEAAGSIPDWLQGLGGESEAEPAEEYEALQEIDTPAEPGELPEWLQEIAHAAEASDVEAVPDSAASVDAAEWQLEQPTVPAGPEAEIVWPEEPVPSPVEPAAEVVIEPDAESAWQAEPDSETARQDESVSSPALSDEDAAFAWLESLAVKQGADEALLLKPEERLEMPPDWVQAAMTAPAAADLEEIPEELSAGPEAEMPAPLDETLEPAPLEETAVAAAEAGPVEAVTGETQEYLPSEPEVEAVWQEETVSRPEPIPELKLEPAETTLAEVEPAEAFTLEAVEAAPDVGDTQPMAPTAPTAVRPEEAPVTSDAQAETEEVPLPSWLEANQPHLAEPAAAEQAPTDVPPELPDWLAGLGESAEAEETLQWTPPVEARPALELNQASLVELERVPGIGFIRAQAILAYRQTHGPLASLKELLSVEGFDTAALAGLQGRVAVTPPAAPAEAVPVEPPPAPAAPPFVGGAPAGLEEARRLLQGGDLTPALETYLGFIHQQRSLPEIIQDLKDAAGRHPYDISVWQTLGDAYARADQFQNALDAYTRAEELLR